MRIGRNIRSALPYIEKLSINRALPSTILITVSEWEAVARIAVPDPARAAAVQPEETENGSQGPLETAQEPWLISVKAHLLEPAPADSTVLLVTGLTPLSPQAGSTLEVPEEEETRLSALISLLEALERAGLFAEVSAVRLDSTQLSVRYADRFDVKMKLNADFDYNIRLMRAVRQQIEAEHGEAAAGSIDLTQEKYDAVFDSAG